MNEETKATIDRARALLSEATPGPWSVRHDGTAAWVDMGDVRRVAWLGHVRGDQNRRDARLMAAAPGLLAALCDALVHAERRAEKAEAQRDELTTLHRVADARERRLERELLAIWATVRPGEPAPLTERDVLHAVEDVQSEAVSLRCVVVDCAKAIGNGSGCSTDASVEFMAMIPAEIRAETSALRDRAGIAKGREAAAKANAEQMAGWLDARNAGLVQMARERDALREKLAALEAKAAQMKAPTAKVCRCVNTTYAFDPARAVVLPLAGYSITAGVGCPSCGGTGAVIVEGGE